MRHILFLPLCAVLLAGCSSFGNSDPNDLTAGSPKQGAFDNAFANMGLATPSRDPIDYRSRPPLAIPPEDKRGQLPPPYDPALAAQENQGWPQDPDVVQQQGGKKSAAKASVQDPSQAALIEPPPGYRASAPNVAGATAQKEKDDQPWWQRTFGSEDSTN